MACFRRVSLAFVCPGIDRCQPVPGADDEGCPRLYPVYDPSMVFDLTFGLVPRE